MINIVSGDVNCPARGMDVKMSSRLAVCGAAAIRCLVETLCEEECKLGLQRLYRYQDQSSNGSADLAQHSGCQ